MRVCFGVFFYKHKILNIKDNDTLTPLFINTHATKVWFFLKLLYIILLFLNEIQ